MDSAYSVNNVLLHKETRDGFQASAFHSPCNDVANSSNNLNYAFGGFAAAKWSSTAGWIAG